MSTGPPDVSPTVRRFTSGLKSACCSVARVAAQEVFSAALKSFRKGIGVSVCGIATCDAFERRSDRNIMPEHRRWHGVRMSRSLPVGTQTPPLMLT